MYICASLFTLVHLAVPKTVNRFLPEIIWKLLISTKEIQKLGLNEFVHYMYLRSHVSTTVYGCQQYLYCGKNSNSTGLQVDFIPHSFMLLLIEP